MPWSRGYAKRQRTLELLAKNEGKIVKDLAGVAVRREDYERLRQLCAHGTTLPSTFDSWSQLIAQADAEATALGLPTSPVDVDVWKFEQWARLVGILPCLEALRAFVILQRQDDSLRH
jgi:hypothetical protein